MSMPNKLISRTHLGVLETPITYPKNMPKEIIIRNCNGTYRYVLQDEDNSRKEEWEPWL